MYFGEATKEGPDDPACAEGGVEVPGAARARGTTDARANNPAASAAVKRKIAATPSAPALCCRSRRCGTLSRAPALPIRFCWRGEYI
jgi:hypothetical protein